MSYQNLNINVNMSIKKKQIAQIGTSTAINGSVNLENLGLLEFRLVRGVGAGQALWSSAPAGY
jgi:hypothetical protein